MGKCASKRVSKIKEEPITDRSKCFEKGTFNIDNRGTINFYVGKDKKLMKWLTKTGGNVFISESSDFTNCLCKTDNKCEDAVSDTGNSGNNPIEEQPKLEGNQNSAFSHLNENTFGQGPSSSGALLLEDNSVTADKFQTLQDDTESNHSSVEMQKIKEVCPDFSEYIDQSSGINISEGFCEDVHKNVHDAKRRIFNQFCSEEVQRRDDSQNKNFDTRSRKTGSVYSGLHFSILSEQRPWWPADGEATSQTYTKENCYTFDTSVDSSTQVKTSNLRHVYCIDGADYSLMSLTESFSRSVTNSRCSSSILTSEDDKTSSSSDFYRNKKINCVSEANKTTEDDVAVCKHSLGQSSLPLPSLDDSEKSISQGYKIGSYRPSLEKQGCEDICDSVIIIEDADKGDSEMEKDSCQALVSSDQTDVHKELIEETESDGFDETFIEVIKKIVEAETHMTLILRDISFLIYSNFITLKLLPCEALNYVLIMDVDCEQFSITNFGYLYFHKALSVVDNMEMNYMQKSMKRISSEPAVSGTIYTNKKNDSEYIKNERSDLKNVHAVVLPDSAGEQMDTVKCDVIEKNHAFISDITDMCGNTCVLLEHEEHAKENLTNCCKGELHEVGRLSNSPEAEKKMTDTKEYSCHADQSKYSANSKHDRDRRKGRPKRFSEERKRKKIVKRRPEFILSKESLDSSLSDSGLTENESVEKNSCCYCYKSLDIENRNCKHHKKIRHSTPELKEDMTSELVPEVRCFDSGIASLSFSFSFSTFTSLSKVKSNRNIIKKTTLKKMTKQRNMRKIMLRGKVPFCKFRNALKNVCAREHSRQIAKEVARVIHVDHRNLPVFGLGSYFDRLNNGPPPTTQEQMQYEWLRLGTFRNYTGRGSAIILARNGFYHDTEGPTSTRCYLCNARNSNWEMLDDVSTEHRRQSPDCPFHASNEQDTLNISISSGYGDSSSVQTRTSAIISASNDATESLSVANLSLGPAVNEATRSLERTQTSLDPPSNREGESIPQQPTEEHESRDRSLLALPKPRGQQSLGRPGHSYSTVMAPKRNNIAVGARSNVGLERAGNGSETSQASQLPGIPPSSILGGPVGAGAFASDPNLTGLNTNSQIPVSTATESGQGSSAVSALSASAGGPGQGPGIGRGTDRSDTVVVNNPKHPDYRTIDSRISSYQGWPDYLDQTPSQMSEAGFFFVGVADFTRCFCCGGGLRNWEPGDDPMLEHTRWFPRCEYVNKLKGERYVAAVQRRHQEHMASQQQQQTEIAQRRDETRNPPDPLTTDAAETLQEMGYSAERTREAILAVRRLTGSPEVSTQQVLTWLLDEEERRLNANTASASSVISTVHTTSITTQVQGTGSSTAELGVTTSEVGDRETEAKQTASSTAEARQTGVLSNSSASSGSGGADKQSGDSDESKSAAPEDTTGTEASGKTTKKKSGKKKSKIKAGTKTETAGATGGGLDAKSLKAENEKLREMQTCKICMEQPVNTTLLPCGHLVCCGSCATRLQRCPICRKRIKGTVKTFMS